MPIATAARSAPRRKRFFKKKNPAKVVKEWELTKLRNQMKRMIPKPEWKYTDVAQAATTITTTATITNLTAVSQGDGDQLRTGDKVTWKNFFIRYAITPNATAGMNYLRTIIFLDRQNNTTPPTATEVLEVATNYMSPINKDWGKRFKVLFDRTYTVDTDATGSQVDKIFRKIRFVTEYDGSATTPNTNGIYILQISDQATNGPSTQFYYRGRFIDP